VIAVEELALGLLLMTSAFFLALALESYRRSGVKVIRWISLALSAHVVATLLMVVAIMVNSSIDDSIRLYMVVSDTVALALILALGIVGGRRSG